MQADVDAHTDDSGQYLDPSLSNEYIDYAGDSAVAESITINSQTLTTASTSEGYIEGCAPGSCDASGADGTIGVAAFGDSRFGPLLAILVDTTQNYSTSDDLLSQAEIDALVGGGPTTGSIGAGNGVQEDSFALDDVNAESSTPEPTTWISLALELGMVGIFQRRRSAR